MQTKAFEGQSGDLELHQSVASVAEDLKGLLKGSTRINDRKGAGSLSCINSVPQVRFPNNTCVPLSFILRLVMLWLHVYISVQHQ